MLTIVNVKQEKRALMTSVQHPPFKNNRSVKASHYPKQEKNKI